MLKPAVCVYAVVPLTVVIVVPVLMASNLVTRKAQTCAVQSRLRIAPKQGRVMVKKGELMDSKTQKPLQLRNSALLSLDGGGLRGILTGSYSANESLFAMQVLCICPSALHRAILSVSCSLHASTSNNLAHDAITMQRSIQSIASVPWEQDYRHQ